MWFTPLCFVDVGETLGICHAVRWIHELQLTKVKEMPLEFGSIVDSSIQFSSSYLTNSHVEFIMRQANEVAHELAKAATSSISLCIFDEISACITDLIFNEMLYVTFPRKNKYM